MRVMLSFVAAAGLLIGAFLSGGRLAPPERGTQSTTSPATILLSADPAPAAAVTEPAAAAPARLPSAQPARGAPSGKPAPVVAPPAAAGADTAEERSAPAAARDPQPAAAPPASVKPPASDVMTATLPSGGVVRLNVALPTPLNVDKTWRHRMAPTPTPPPVKRATVLAPISPPRDDVRPTPAPGRGTPSLSAQAPTSTPCCGLDPPPLDRARPGPGR